MTPIDAILPIKTDHLLIRIAEEPDVETIKSLYALEEVEKHVGVSPWRPQRGESRHATFLRLQRSRRLPLITTTADRTQPIGCASLQPYTQNDSKPGDFEITVCTVPIARSRGFASEALRAIIEAARSSRAVRRIIGRVAPNNPACLRILQKLQMAQIGCVPNNWTDQSDLLFSLDLRS